MCIFGRFIGSGGGKRDSERARKVGGIKEVKEEENGLGWREW